MSVSYNLSVDQGATLAFSTTWLQSLPASTWAADTIYGLGDTVSPLVSNGYLYDCTTAGLSDANEPVWLTTVSDTVTDGTVVWTCTGPDVAPVDLTGYTAYMTVATAKNPTTSGAVIWATVTTTSSTQGVITLGGVAGTVEVRINGEATILFTQNGFYDLFVVSPSDVVTMLLTGKVQMNSNVTTPVYD